MGLHRNWGLFDNIERQAADLLRNVDAPAGRHEQHRARGGRGESAAENHCAPIQTAATTTSWGGSAPT